FMGTADIGTQRYLHGHMAEWSKWDSALSSDGRQALVDGVRPTEIGTRPAWYMPMSAGLDEEIVGLATTNGGTTTSEHPPRVVFSGISRVLRANLPTVNGPYRVDAATMTVCGAVVSDVFNTGSKIGQVDE
ncbi:MAG: hypothetical protein JXM70_13805, partial [Pirellulales bacterium]|nr:hypothetical protein [Pirellulales bacterium]